MWITECGDTAFDVERLCESVHDIDNSIKAMDRSVHFSEAYLNRVCPMRCEWHQNTKAKAIIFVLINSGRPFILTFLNSGRKNTTIEWYYKQSVALDSILTQ